MTIEELHNDTTFLEGLRKGEFCLVLGAGFSYGLSKNCRIKNKTNHPTSLYQNIPLTSEFIKITNLEFPAANVIQFPDAVQLWENMINNNNDKKELFRNLFLADETYLKKNILPQFKHLLIPNWYRVFTFNFDDVFEQIAGDEFESLAYPDDKEFKSTIKKQIAHVHGMITDKSDLQKLVFFGNKYATLQKSFNDLYYSLVNSVSQNQSRGLVVLGCRFNEIIQLQKFHQEVKGNHKPLLYQFDIRQPSFSGGVEHLDYKFIPSSTANFLKFIHDNKTDIENIKIEGADVINSDFIERVKLEGTKEGFTASVFYLAKQVDDCQWYGVTQNWAVERDNYNFIKQEAISSIADEKRNSKISALVWGLGGSGKSTLLRKLAIDLSNEYFAVLWIKDKSIERFCDKGLSQLRSRYPHKRFLVIIEDLYRAKQQDVNLNQIIDSICGNNNVRLVVSDRRNDDNTYKEHIYNPDKNIVELTVDENKKTLDKVLENIPEWKTVADKLLRNEDDYQSTLYYILWTIGRTVQKEKEGFSFAPNPDLVSHFRSLVKSDLKELHAHYPGVAKMLCYWSCIYAKNKIYIAYDLFLTLAESFNTPTANKSKFILASTKYKSILDIYTHKATGFIKSAGELPLFAFNHDILAEDGLSKSELTGFHPFDDSIKLKMLSVIVRDGDNFSSSNFLSHCLRLIPDDKFSKEEKSKYVSKLRAKGNFNNYLMSAFGKDFYSVEEKHQLAKEILLQPKFWLLDPTIIEQAFIISKDKIKAEELLSQPAFWVLNPHIVRIALNISKDKKKVKVILSQPEFWLFHPMIVSVALNILEDKEKAKAILSQPEFWLLNPMIVSVALSISKDKEKIKVILSQPEFWLLNPIIVSTALNVSKDKEKVDKILSQNNFWKEINFVIVSNALKISKDKEKADKILSQNNFWKEINFGLVSIALNISKDKEKADKILSQNNFWNLDKEIVSTALNISKDKEKADKILSQNNFWNLDKEIVSTALNISKDKEKADKILSQNNFWKEINFVIVCTALKISKDKEKADKILSQNNFWNLDKEIVSTALNISENEAIKKAVAEKLFVSGHWKERWGITWHILYFYSEQKVVPKQVNQICETVITEYFSRTNANKGKFFRYINLMKIPLHSLVVWKRSSLENIRRWENRQRNLVTNTIIAYRSFPDEIKGMCEAILKNWENELIK